MHFQLSSLKEISNCLPQFLADVLGFDDQQTEMAMFSLVHFTANFVDGVWVGIESSYVDKLYRDAYYNYYSSKLSEYKRDCIRLSFFAGPVQLDDFFSGEGTEKLQSLFRGFLVLRPTPRNVIGRNVLQPCILKKEVEYKVSVTSFSACIYGVKLSIEGFPHSAQDAEFMVCAETTIWSTMEYFSNRYPEYRPILPRRIHNILASTTMERQVPSNGLNVMQMSFALKELGFGVKTYSATMGQGENQLLDLVKIYVESGIPLMALLQNNKGIAHVVNVVGRTNFASPISAEPIYQLQNGSSIHNFYHREAKYLLIDENHPAYAPVPLENPACHYKHPQWDGCKIIGAIVPLHTRVYMEALRATELALLGLNSLANRVSLPDLCLRILLTSTRTFKHAVAHNPDLSRGCKTLLLSLDMPKFVWMAEIGDRQSFSKGKATGIMLMDATEPEKKEILAYLLENMYIGKAGGKSTVLSLPLRPFQMHQNLKSF